MIRVSSFASEIEDMAGKTTAMRRVKNYNVRKKVKRRGTGKEDRSGKKGEDMSGMMDVRIVVLREDSM